jgi:hypothetical protein
LRITPQCVIESGPRWRNFLTDPPIQHVFRNHWSRLAAALESPGAVDLPNSSHAISTAWDDLVSHLHTTYGRPAATLGQIKIDYDGNHWYCEHFSKVE